MRFGVGGERFRESKEKIPGAAGGRWGAQGGTVALRAWAPGETGGVCGCPQDPASMIPTASWATRQIPSPASSATTGSATSKERVRLAGSAVPPVAELVRPLACLPGWAGVSLDFSSPNYGRRRSGTSDSSKKASWATHRINELESELELAKKRALVHDIQLILGQVWHPCQITLDYALGKHSQLPQ